MALDNNDNDPVPVRDWPTWKGTPLDLIMYAGYIFGRDILYSPPWIAYQNCVRLSAGSGLSLTIHDVNGLVLLADTHRKPDNQDELIANVADTIDALIARDDSISFGDILDDNTFLCNLTMKVARLRANQTS